MNRRTFVCATAAGVATLSSARAAARLPIKKAVYVGMLPRTAPETGDKPLTWADRFKIASDAGFEEVECATEENPQTVEEIGKAAKAAGLRIHSVMNQAHWKMPLSSADPDVVAKSVKGMETSLRNANAWGADTVLLVPAVVGPETSYRDAWTRSQEQVRKLIPLAEKMKVIIGIENVWNKFLLSPLEMARYVDDFKSPWVRAYFDVGNVVLFGYPQDWIRTLGKRIVKLHLKDFKNEKRQLIFTQNLKEGEINWAEIYAALNEIGYRGTATVELRNGDAAYLKEVVRRFETILTNES
jgi:L-ribulose-5-phosphate 3-epimerase